MTRYFKITPPDRPYESDTDDEQDHNGSNCMSGLKEMELITAIKNRNKSLASKLIAEGIDGDFIDENWIKTFECALKMNHIKVIETLCMFGLDIDIIEKALKRVVAERDYTQDQQLKDILQLHWNRSAAFKFGEIMYDVKYISKGTCTSLKNIDVTVQGKGVPFIFYCCKLPVEYSPITRYVNSKQELFGDVYECRKWGGPQKVFTLTIMIKGVIKSNETPDIASPDGKIGHIDDTSQSTKLEENDFVQYTEFKATISLRPNTITTFVFVKTKKPESIAISSEAIKFKPKIEPEAEIDIPKDTFDGPGDLLLNVVETKDMEGDSNAGIDAVLLTNVLEISTSDNQQPKRPIGISLPTHFRLGKDTEIAVLTSSHEFPTQLKDWEILPCILDSNGKLARFKLSHFSPCIAVSNQRVQANLSSVIELVQRAVNHKQNIEFFAMVKTASEKEYLVVIECALLRNVKPRKKFWRQQHYEQQDPESVPGTVNFNSSFRITFEGNINKTKAAPTDDDRLMFLRDRDNFRKFSVELTDPKVQPKGLITIGLVEEKVQEPIEVVESTCFGVRVKTKAQDPIKEITNLASLPVNFKPPQRPQGSSARQIDLYDPTCHIKALCLFSLHQLTKTLVVDDIRKLAAELQYKPDEISTLEASHPSPENFLMYLLKDWRGACCSDSQVPRLAYALIAIGKTLEGNALLNAFAAGKEMQL